MITLKILGKSLRDNKRDTLLSVLFVALEVICECTLPFVMARLIDSSGVDVNSLVIYGVILVVLATVSLFCGIKSGKCAARAGAGYSANLRDDMFVAIQNYSFANIDKFSSSSLVTRMTTDITNIQNSFSIIIRIAVRVPLMMLFSIIMAFVISPSLAWIFLLCVPILGGIIVLIVSKATPTFSKVFARYDTLNNSVHENIKGIRVVKTYVREDYENKKFAASADAVTNDFVHGEKIVAWLTPSMNLFMYVCYIVISVLGAFIITGKLGWGVLTTGDLSSLITYGINILSSLMMFAMVLIMMTMSVASAKRIAEVLVEQSTLTSPENAVKEVDNGSVTFNNVSFRYSLSATNDVLSNINLQINSGETIGIIGGTGSSKTSLVNLISRLYDVTSGEVLVGNRNVKEYDLDTLRQKVSVVLQKNVLFSGTIEENLRWGDETATEEEMIDACKIAHADEYIKSFPKGYQTYLEEGGINLSGGQKQRLCIARALLRKPKIIIFDDSTSAVDTKTDALIRKGLKDSLPNTTKIIITQRISSVEEADKIVVLDKGEINGVGIHEELLKNNEIYRDINSTQTEGDNRNE
ncbi:MAG: ABC transporter ATP-binding protein [Clostridia bacterium]|nr:ABC transporter ATP-binding protein [Clostridia bacterium]